ncbi:AAA family ATPase, partial [Streptomyces sparsus]
MTPTTTGDKLARLYGRNRELAVLRMLLTQVNTGRSGTLLLAAPPGLGRTALLRHVLARHPADRVLHTTAVPTEQGLPYSGLHALLCSAAAPLPAAPDDVLSSAMAPAALLDLLRTLTAAGPLLVCVDDVHAWDAQSRAALLFAAHRLPADRPLALLLTAVRHGRDVRAVLGLPTLGLTALDDTAAGTMLDRLVPGPLDPGVRAELLREAAGNPALLAALTDQLTPDQRAGRAPLPQPLPGGEAVLDAYAAALAALPPDTRELLLLAAAAGEHETDTAGTGLDLLARAGRQVGIDDAQLSSAEAAGIVHVHAGRVSFTHPLLRRAVYRAAPLARRRSAHRLLGTVLDGPHRTLPRLIQQACAA